MAINYILARNVLAVLAEAVHTSPVWPWVLGPPSPLYAITLHAPATNPGLASQQAERKRIHDMQASTRQKSFVRWKTTLQDLCERDR